MSESYFIEVCLNVPLRTTFDYHCSTFTPIIGARVEVPWGKTTKTGIITDIKSQSSYPKQKIKHAISCLDEAAIISPALMSLIQWASDYYHHPIGEVLVGTLCPNLRHGKAAQIKPTYTYALTQLGTKALENSTTLARAPKQQALLKLIEKQPQQELSHYTSQGFNREQIKTLQAKGYINAQEQAETNTPSIADDMFLPLNEEQKHAYESISALSSFSTHLIYGITGSGKTEIYMHWIRDMLNCDQQILVLVPEIALTPQTQHRFEKRFPNATVMIHSKLSPTQQLKAWWKSQHLKASIILGTRSALFYPIPKLGGIIIDEEHDLSYQQTEGFRYNARDTAIMRAKLENVPIALGSATPSIESYYNAMQKRFHLIHIKSRAGGAKLPQVHIIDTKKHPLTNGFSKPLIDRMRHYLDQKKQVLLFLNKRGFAPVVFCPECGFQAMCTYCDAKMTFHQAAHQIHCHHCGHRKSAPDKCPSCQFPDIIHLGLGTEQIHQHCQYLFPQHKIIRIDSDTIKRPSHLNDALALIKNKQVDIVIGTQMMAKGHHFDHMNLVAILDIDQGLFSSAFQALEHTAQLITQVSGRSGRGTSEGEVILQTKQPQHPILISASQHNYTACLEHLLFERKHMQLPPFSYLSSIEIQGEKKSQVSTLLKKCQAWLKAHGHPSCEYYGPVDALLKRKMNRHHMHLYIQSTTRQAIHHSIKALLQTTILTQPSQKIRWFINIDI